MRAFLGISLVWVPLAFLFDGVTALVLPVRLGGGATDLGLVSFVGLALAAAVQPVVGAFGDRRRDRMDRGRFVAIAAVPAIGGLWLLVGSAGVAAALAGYVVVQVAASTMQAGTQALIPEHVDPGAQGRAAGWKAAFDVGGAFLAFLVLGALLAGGALVPAAIATTAVVVVGVLALLAAVPRRAAPRGAPAGPSPATVAGDGRVELPASFVPLVAARFLFLFASYAVYRFLLLLVAQRLGIPPERAGDEAGGLLAVFGLATAVAALGLGRLADRVPRRELMVAGALAGAAGALLLLPDAGLGGLLAGGLVMSVGTASFVTANWSATTAIVPAAEAGRLMGLANLGTAGAAACAGLMGPLIDAGGFAPALVVSAVLAIAAIGPVLVAHGAGEGAVARA